MLKKAEESSIQYSRRVDASICACASDVCAGNFSHSLRLSRASFMLALWVRAVLISSPDMWDWTRMQALVVIHRWTLCENVDSSKIKVPFYTTDIDILHVASMHCIIIHRYIDPYRWIVTPLVQHPLWINQSISKIHFFRPILKY